MASECPLRHALLQGNIATTMQTISESTGFGADHFSTARARRRSRIQGIRVLYVDDEPLMRLAVARLLRRAGAVCVGAGTHDQAVVLLAFELSPELAILDFHMPDGDVALVIRRLLSQRPNLTLVGTSASDERSEFAARGVDRFLPKPWGIDDLICVADWSEAAGSRVGAAG